MNSILITKEGYKQAQTDYDGLVSKRKITVGELRKYREMGDLSENGAYKGAKAQLGSIDYQLRKLQRILSTAKIIQKRFTDIVGVGSTIVIKSDEVERTFLVVGPHEASPSEGKISFHSPLGKALLGKRVGESVIIETPSGKSIFKILKLE